MSTRGGRGASDLPIIAFASGGYSALPASSDPMLGGAPPLQFLTHSPYIQQAQSWDNAALNAPLLFPYRQARPPARFAGFWRERVVRSAFLEAVPLFAILYGIAVINTVLWQYEVYPHRWFPPFQDPNVFDNPWALFVVVFLVVVAAIYGITYEYYQGSVRRYLFVLDRLQRLADFFSRFIVADPLRSFEQPIQSVVYATSDRGSLQQLTVLELYTEAGHLLKTIAYAVKYRFRKNGQLFDPRLLPLPSYMRNELMALGVTYRQMGETEGGDRYIEALITMFQKRVSELDGITSTSGMTYTIQDNIQRITEWIAEIYFYRTVWSTIQRLIDVMRVAGVVWLVYLPFRYFHWFGLWTLAWFAIPAIIVTSLFVVVAQRLNPFDNVEDSPYVFYDLGGWAHEAAEHIDLAFSFASYEKVQRLAKRS